MQLFCLGPRLPTQAKTSCVGLAGDASFSCSFIICRRQCEGAGQRVVYCFFDPSKYGHEYQNQECMLTWMLAHTVDALPLSKSGWQLHAAVIPQCAPIPTIRCQPAFEFDAGSAVGCA